ncbi:MAG: hypothetical protein PHI71_12425, partial [Acidiphilium sp.]|nr:hypothetical protein [Acidiphilium sp.]
RSRATGRTHDRFRTAIKSCTVLLEPHGPSTHVASLGVWLLKRGSGGSGGELNQRIWFHSGLVERSVATRNPSTGLLRQTSETAFYVANRPITAARAAKAIRAHWKIENTSHYTRDVTMGEDLSRIRTNPGIFARMRSFGFNILMVSKIGTMKQDRYRAALAGVRYLLSLLARPKR